VAERDDAVHRREAYLDGAEHRQSPDDHLDL
jgi:hypothetical protein